MATGNVSSSTVKSKHLLFIGNPGAGKSTLLNCLMKSRDETLPKDAFFESGISYGSGMTFQLDTRTIGDTTYMDTPGLEDIEKRKQAAAAITEALKTNGNYRVVFVVTLEAGRIRAVDLATINLVLSCAEDLSHYGVIFNKIGTKYYPKLDQDENLKWRFVTQVSSQDEGDKPTPFALFLPEIEDLKDEDNAITSIPALKRFLSTMPFLKVHEEHVKDIPGESFQEVTEAMETKVSTLMADREQLLLKMEEDKKMFDLKMQDIIEKEEERHGQEKEELQQNNEKMLGILQQQVQMAKDDAARADELNDRRYKEMQDNMASQSDMMGKMFEQMSHTQEAQIKALQNQKKSGGFTINLGLPDVLNFSK